MSAAGIDFRTVSAAHFTRKWNICLSSYLQVAPTVKTVDGNMPPSYEEANAGIEQYFSGMHHENIQHSNKEPFPSYTHNLEKEKDGFTSADHTFRYA